MQRVFYRIAERATAGLSFYDFLRVVHQLLRELMFADNFYVALHDHDRGLMDYPYYVDEKDGDIMQREGVPYKRGMTEFVLESGKPQLMDTHRFLELRKSGFMASYRRFDIQLLAGRTHANAQPHGGCTGGAGLHTGCRFTTSDDMNILGFFANHVSRSH